MGIPLFGSHHPPISISGFHAETSQWFAQAVYGKLGISGI
jgi:hypothetical protein